MLFLTAAAAVASADAAATADATAAAARMCCSTAYIARYRDFVLRLLQVKHFTLAVASQ